MRTMSIEESLSFGLVWLRTVVQENITNITDRQMILTSHRLTLKISAGHEKVPSTTYVIILGVLDLKGNGCFRSYLL